MLAILTKNTKIVNEGNIAESDLLIKQSRIKKVASYSSLSIKLFLIKRNIFYCQAPSTVRYISENPDSPIKSPWLPGLK